MAADPSTLQVLRQALDEFREHCRQPWYTRLFRRGRGVQAPLEALVRHGEHLATREQEHQQVLAAFNRTLVEHERQLAEWSGTRVKLGVLSAQVGALAAHAATVAATLEAHGEHDVALGREQAKLAEEAVAQARQLARLADAAETSRRALAETATLLTALRGAAETGRGETRAELDRLVASQAALQFAQQAHHEGLLRAQADVARLLRDRGPDRPDEFASFYLAFENRFRGSPEEIAARLRIYLPDVASAIQRAGSGKPWVDLGCGRGEWLEILRGEGVDARGVDDNVAMLESCRQRNLPVECGDALAFLERQEPESLAGLSAFHLIEHLPYRTMIALFRAAQRALAPGGVLIVETPNPQNVSVGACNFYMDVTHQKPIPPMTAEFIAEHAGFKSVTVVRLHPFPRHAERDQLPTVTDREYCEMFYGPQDYAIVAIK